MLRSIFEFYNQIKGRGKEEKEKKRAICNPNLSLRLVARGGFREGMTRRAEGEHVIGGDAVYFYETARSYIIRYFLYRVL